MDSHGALNGQIITILSVPSLLPFCADLVMPFVFEWRIEMEMKTSEFMFSCETRHGLAKVDVRLRDGHGVGGLDSFSSSLCRLACLIAPRAVQKWKSVW